MSGTPGPIVLWDATTPGTGGWRANAAAGAAATAARDGAALRLDVTLAGHGSWAILRHEAPLVLPPHYVAVLAVRGTLPPTELQVKLVHTTGANVWWWRLRLVISFMRPIQRLLAKWRKRFGIRSRR